MNSTVDKTEVNHFDKPNQDWWDESGSFSALHRLTPCRIEYIVQVIKRNIIHQQINSSNQICNNLNEFKNLKGKFHENKTKIIFNSRRYTRDLENIYKDLIFENN